MQPETLAGASAEPSPRASGVGRRRRTSLIGSRAGGA